MKPRFLLALLLLLAAVALSSWFLYKDDIKQVILPQASHIPDYTLDNFVYHSFTSLGTLDYRIHGNYMEHLPDRNIYLITGLDYSAYKRDRVDWTASAEKAKLQGSNQVLELTGDVQISFFDPQEAKPIRMQTEAMTIYAKRDYAENRLPTRFIFANGSVSSQGGFELDGKARTLKMFGGIVGDIRHD